MSAAANKRKISSGAVQAADGTMTVLAAWPVIAALEARGVDPAASLAAAGLSREALAPFDPAGTENPYTLHHELQKAMQSDVGIIRVQNLSLIHI